MEPPERRGAAERLGERKVPPWGAEGEDSLVEGEKARPGGRRGRVLLLHEA